MAILSRILVMTVRTYPKVHPVKVSKLIRRVPGVLGCDHVDKMIMDAQNHHQVFRVIIRDTVDPEWMSDVVGGLVAKRQLELIHTVVADW